MTAVTAWRIQHIDLGAELPGLERSPGHAGLTAVLWLHGVPLGRLDYLDAELPVPASALAAAIPRAIAPAVGDRLFGRGFEGALPLRGPVPPSEPDLGAILSMPDLLGALKDALALPPAPAEGQGLSVIICTRDRPVHLARCLDSLEPGQPWIGEIIVVDNGSRPEAVRALVANHPKARYVAEPRPGLSIARNTGIRQARHEILAFTDDDVQVHPDWAARILAGFSTPETMCVTGLVLPTELETEAQVVFERELGGFGQGLQRMCFDAAFFARMLRYGVPVWRIGAGANMAIRRSALERVGAFDERLGAGAAGCSEDSELWYRLLAAGWTCRYEPAAVVFHEHRREWQELRRQMHDYMRGHVAALLVQYAQHRHAGNLRRLALSIPHHYAMLLARAAFHRRFSGRFRLIGTEVLGALSGLGAIRWAGRKDRTPLPRPEEAAP
ncbi:MAG: glycosyltransferase [Acetobacteraceae bacterium]|nr:glycosyltransferase [Acetobacteraceae bacterium]